MLHQILYVSVETHSLTKEDLTELLGQSRKKNAKLGVTGILIYYKKHFLQILEGEKEVVFDLFREIRNDKRHLSVILVYDQPVKEHSFRDWTMGFLDLNGVDNSKLEGFSQFLEKGFSMPLGAHHLTMVQQLLMEFKQCLDTGSREKFHL